MPTVLVSVKQSISNLESKKDKKEVNYSKGMRKSRCGICKYYIPGKNQTKGTCEKVKGSISSEMWCKLFKER